MSRAAPIPIGPRRTGHGGAPGAPRGGFGSGGVSASLPVAPVIGSLPPPATLFSGMPDLALPGASPEAFSLVRRREKRVVLASGYESGGWLPLPPPSLHKTTAPCGVCVC